MSGNGSFARVKCHHSSNNSLKPSSFIITLSRSLFSKHSSDTNLLSWCEGSPKKSKWLHMNSLPSSKYRIYWPFIKVVFFALSCWISELRGMMVRSTVLPLVWPDLAATYPEGMIWDLSMKG